MTQLKIKPIHYIIRVETDCVEVHRMGKINYTIDTKKGVIYTKITGNISFELLRQHVSSVYSDPSFDINLNSISDLSKAKIEPSFTDISGFREFMLAYERQRMNFKWAVIVSEKQDLRAFKLFKILSEGALFTLKYFNSLEEAENWVTNKDP